MLDQDLSRPGAAEQVRRPLHEQIRDALIEGRHAPGSRLKVQDLAAAYGTSSNPVREALQRLQGEGFVIIKHNQGALVRPIGSTFVRNVYEVIGLIEPYLIRWFVEHATEREIVHLAELIEAFEAHNFAVPDTHRRLDDEIHGLTYLRHYNHQAIELWHQKRAILTVLSRRFITSPARRRAVLNEHRALFDAVQRHEPEEAAQVIERHVRGSGRHLMEQLNVTASI